MTITTLNVTVVGAGIGGLATALLLGRTGARVTLLERTTAPTTVGAGLLLQPNGLAVLQALGLDAKLAGFKQIDGALRKPSGGILAALAAPNYGPGLDHVLAVRRSVLHETLLDAIHDEPMVTRRWGSTVLRAHPGGRVDVMDHDEKNWLSSDLVVGADGVGSPVRQSGNFDVRTSRGTSSYLRALVDRTSSSPTLSGEYWTPLGLFGGAPLDSHTQYFYADAGAPTVATALAAGDLPALRATWSKALPLAGDLLGQVGNMADLLINDVSIVECGRWVDGRLVLLGDAAHAMPPTAGQGANSALVDAAVLVSELTRNPLPQALRAYQQRRQGQVRHVQQQANRLAKMASIRGPLARGVRDIVLRAVDQVPGSAQRLADRLQQENPVQLRSELLAVLQAGPVADG